MPTDAGVTCTNAVTLFNESVASGIRPIPYHKYSLAPSGPEELACGVKITPVAPPDIAPELKSTTMSEAISRSDPSISWLSVSPSSSGIFGAAIVTWSATGPLVIFNWPLYLLISASAPSSSKYSPSFNRKLSPMMTSSPIRLANTCVSAVGIKEATAVVDTVSDPPTPDLLSSTDDTSPSASTSVAASIWLTVFARPGICINALSLQVSVDVPKSQLHIPPATSFNVLS